MKVQWQKLWFKTILWLGAEILLTLMGLDHLADYSEFLYQQKEVASIGKAYPIRQAGGEKIGQILAVLRPQRSTQIQARF